MTKLEKFLKDNHITYKSDNWGDNYFGDSFHVPGLLVSFDGYLDSDAYVKLQKFRTYMKRRRVLDCYQIRSGAITSFRILSNADADLLKEHDEKKRAAIEEFWRNRKAS